jgi:hypothetical protein
MRISFDVDTKGAKGLKSVKSVKCRKMGRPSAISEKGLWICTFYGRFRHILARFENGYHHLYQVQRRFADGSATFDNMGLTVHYLEWL